MDVDGGSEGENETREVAGAGAGVIEKDDDDFLFLCFFLSDSVGFSETIPLRNLLRAVSPCCNIFLLKTNSGIRKRRRQKIVNCSNFKRTEGTAQVNGFKN